MDSSFLLFCVLNHSNCSHHRDSVRFLYSLLQMLLVKLDFQFYSSCHQSTHMICSYCCHCGYYCDCCCRWEKVVSRIAERGRQLDQALREAKGFNDNWTDLCQWLDNSDQLLDSSQVATNDPEKIKAQILKHKVGSGIQLFDVFCDLTLSSLSRYALYSSPSASLLVIQSYHSTSIALLLLLQLTTEKFMKYSDKNTAIQIQQYFPN